MNWRMLERDGNILFKHIISYFSWCDWENHEQCYPANAVRELTSRRVDYEANLAVFQGNETLSSGFVPATGGTGVWF